MATKPKSNRNLPNNEAQRRQLGNVKRVVVKVGSGVITAGGRLRPKVIEALAADVSTLRQRGFEVVLVVSGAVSAGFRALDLPRPPDSVVDRQAAASVGQYRLMATFARAFRKHDTHVAQLLMMQEDFEHRRRFLSARHTLQRLISQGIIPVINENDPLADDEAKIGDNDHLAALVTSVTSAELLIILSTVAGVYRQDEGSVIADVEVGSCVDHHVSSSVSEAGVGDMRAKVSAAHLASRWGVPTIIADGNESGLLPRIASGEPIGTLFHPRQGRLTARKRWIAVRTRSHGAVRVDRGAKRAVVSRGASLLPAGVIDVAGRFSMGARVDVLDEQGDTFAFGLTSYSSDEIRRMKGRKQSEYTNILGYQYVAEIIDRDDMVLINGTENEKHP